MENKLLNKIKSKYICKIIFDLTYDNLKYKLFNHSKHFQSILDIKLINYKEKYWTKKGIKLDEYLSFKTQNNYNPNHFNKKLLYDKLKSFTDKNNINLDSLKSYLIDYYINQKNLKAPKLFIDIYSPFFEELSKNECFDLFIIPIEIDFIIKNQLVDDYKTAFKKMNNNELNNICVKINYKNENDIKLLLGIIDNFEKIQDLDFTNIGNEKNIKYDDLFKKIFSAKNFGQNLKKLYLKIHDVWGTINEINIFEKINNLTNLKSLELNGFKFQKNFELNLKNIISLTLRNCSNIVLSSSNSLQDIILSNSIMIKNKSLAKFNNLEKCELLNYRKGQNFNSIIDFSSLINIKYLTCLPHDFIHLTENSYAENINLFSIELIEPDIEANLVKKIFKLKHLKDISFSINNNIFEEIVEINETNTSLNKMNIAFKEMYEINNFSEFIKKFENLSEIKIDINIGEDESVMELKIEEDNNCKIDKLSLYGFGFQNFEIICGPYSNLVELDLHENGQISNLDQAFPLFQKNCEVKFNKMTKFFYSNWELLQFETPLTVLENLYNNLNKIPNLKNFELVCIVSEISKEFYEKFIKKLLEMKLDYIKFTISKKDEEGDIYDTADYTLEELIEIYPDTLINKNYSISKYPENPEIEE